MSARRATRKPIADHQVKNLHVLKAKLGMDEETYHMVLAQYPSGSGEGCTTSKELSFDQAGQIIGMWYKQAVAMGYTVNLFRGEPAKYASAQQIKKIHFHSMSSALHYAEMPAYTAGRGIVMQGDALRTWLRARFDRRDRLPTECMGPIWKWIDNRTKRMLVEGGFYTQPEAIRKQTVYWQQLSPEQADYLIIRWRAVHEQVGRRQAAEPPALADMFPQHLN